MNEELNTVPKEEFNNNLNKDIPEEEPLVNVKDIYGVWTEEQIAENTYGYIEHLKRQLQFKTTNADEISKINEEIKNVEEKYLLGESRGR